jgi:hypothetical protein
VPRPSLGPRAAQGRSHTRQTQLNSLLIEIVSRPSSQWIVFVMLGLLRLERLDLGLETRLLGNLEEVLDWLVALGLCAIQDGILDPMLWRFLTLLTRVMIGNHLLSYFTLNITRNVTRTRMFWKLVTVN